MWTYPYPFVTPAQGSLVPSAACTEKSLLPPGFLGPGGNKFMQILCRFACHAGSGGQPLVNWQ